LLHTLDAEIVCHSNAGDRSVPIAEFIRDSYTTILDDAELVTEIRFKAPPANSGGAYIGFKKSAPAYPTAAVGVQLTLADGNVCQNVRLALGAAGPRPVTSDEAESLLQGKVLTSELLEQAAESIVAASDPPEDSRGTSDFKRAILRSLFMQAAHRAIERAGGTQIMGKHEYV
jgi:carbon-monoxide dehydrogenase medium subunit